MLTHTYMYNKLMGVLLFTCRKVHVYLKLLFFIIWHFKLYLYYINIFIIEFYDVINVMLSFLQLLTYVWSWWGRKNWYFSLDGFCFLFKQPYKTRSMFISTPLWYLKLPIIILKGFKTTICASYQLSVQTQKDKRNQLSLPTEQNM